MRQFVLVLCLVMCNTSQALAFKVYPRVMTPNGDGRNDAAFFEVDNPALMPISGIVYDANGSRVGDMVHGLDQDTILVWDGRRNGEFVPSGVYFYRIEVGTKILTGSVVVAR